MAEADKKEKNKEHEKEAAPPKKGGGLKWIIIALAMLLVAGGGGYASWKTFLKPAEKEVSEGKPKEVKADVGPTVPLDTFIVNLAGAAGERYLKVSMEVELKEAPLVEQLEHLKPQVKDTILLLLSSKTFDDVATFQGKTKLRNEITLRLNSLLPPASVKKVYFTEFVVQ